MENVYLTGSDAVQTAGMKILLAAQEISRAADEINKAFYSFKEQVDRLEELLVVKK